jgi:hypothetical protein
MASPVNYARTGALFGPLAALSFILIFFSVGVAIERCTSFSSGHGPEAAPRREIPAAATPWAYWHSGWWMDRPGGSADSSAAAPAASAARARCEKRCKTVLTEGCTCLPPGVYPHGAHLVMGSSVMHVGVTIDGDTLIVEAPE